MPKIHTASSLKDFNFSDHVTPWLTFRESKLQNSFEEFRVSQPNKCVIVGLQVVLTLMLLPLKLAIAHYFPTTLNYVVLALTIVFGVGFGWFYVFLRFSASYCKSKFNSSARLQIIEAIWMFTSCFASTFGLFVIAHNGRCTSNDSFLVQQGCLHTEKNHMPEDRMIICLMFPIMFAIILSGGKWQCVMAAYCCNFALFITTMCVFQLTESLPVLFLVVPISVLVLYANQRQNLSLFLLTQKQKHLLEENERLADENHATEMRHMIGNVAHDLKTVRFIHLTLSCYNF